jgi:hypothetical protein
MSKENNITTSKKTLRIEKDIDKIAKIYYDKEAALVGYNTIKWKEISSIKDLSDDFVIKYSKKLDWTILIENKFSNIKKINFEFNEKFKPRLRQLAGCIKMTDRVLIDNFNTIKHNHTLFIFQQIPSVLIEKSINCLNDYAYELSSFLVNQKNINLDIILKNLKKIEKRRVSINELIICIQKNKGINKEEKNKILNYFKLIK